VSYYSSNDTYQDLVKIAVEKTLLEIGPHVYDEVLTRMKDDYNCDFSDCLEHPDYLKRILKNIFGNSYNSIINSIQLFLLDFNSNRLENFLKCM